MAQKLIVEIIGDSSSFERALKGATKTTTGFGSSIGKMAKIAAIGAGAAGIGGLVLALKASIDSANEHAKVYAQTNAVIKSTGDISNVTQKSVQALANEIEKKSGVDDVAIQSGENMLLTFTNIRNEAGKGNQVFDEATRTLTDMSVALGQDMPKSAIQLGKALNDPIKGITALQRVGVTFDEGQKKQIASMVKAGNTMGAQKLILAELNKEFGGSADALGRTLPGQINILKARFDDIAQKIGQTLIPALTSVLNWVNANWPTITAVIQTVFDGVKAAFEGIKTTVQVTVAFIQSHWAQITAVFEQVKSVVVGAVMSMVNAVRNNWPQIVSVATEIFNNLKTIVLTTITVIKAYWNQFGGAIKTIISNTWNQVKSIIQAALNIVRGIFNIIGGLLKGDWSRVWQGIKQLTSGLLGGIVATIRGLVGNFLAAATAIGSAILRGVLSLLESIGGKVRNKLERIWGAITGVASAAFNKAVAIGTGIIEGIISGLGGLIGRVKDKITSSVTDAISSAWDALTGSPYVTAAIPIGHGIMYGVSKGVQDGTAGVASVIGGAVGVMFSGAATAITAGIAGASAAMKAGVVTLIAGLKAQLAAARGSVASAFSAFTSAATSAFDQAGGGSPATRALAKKLKAEQDAQKAQADKDAAAGRDKALADAQAAQAGIKPNAGESDADFQARAAAAQAAVDAAVKAIADAKEQAQIDADAKALAEAQKRDKDNFEKQLAALEAQANSAKTAEQLGKIKAKIKTLLSQYGITPDSLQAGTDWQTAQSLFVGALGDLKKSLDGLRDALNNIGPGGLPKKQHGGYLSGAGGIPIMAHGGEYVIRKSAVDRLGVGFMNRLNRYQGGGIVDPATGVPWELPLTSAVGSGPAYEIWRQRVKVAKYNKKVARIMASRALYNPAMLPTPASRADSTIDDWLSALGSDALFTERLGALKSFVDSGDAYRGGAVSRSWLTYGVPRLATGGHITRSGLAYVHRGETVTPAGAGGNVIHVYVGEKEVAAIIRDGIVEDGRKGGPLAARTP